MIETMGAWTRSDRGARWMRYAAVSVASVAIGQLTLALSFGLAGLSARPSNYLAFVAGAVPSYTLNRRWTWGRSGRSHLTREVLPFCALAVAGLLLSTWAVGAAESTAASATDERAIQTLVVMAASLGAYGAIWVAKFLAFDRILFRG